MSAGGLNRRIMKKIFNRLAVLAAVALLGAVSGCSGQKQPLDPSAPTVVTLWHAYNAYAKVEFDKCIETFNDTVGKEKGIIVDAYGYGASDELDEALYGSANQVIGSDPLPDLFTAYPDSAYRLDQIAPLMDLRNYFSEGDLAKYRPEFLQDGIWEEDGARKMLPIAKSTELLFVNETEYSRFARATGADPAELSTWEGLAKTAEAYYQWSGGKPFLGMNSYNDFALLSAVQLGREPYRPENGSVVFDYPQEAAKRVWDVYYVPHLMGWYRSETFNQDGIKSGNLAAYIGSSAGAGYFPEDVIVSGAESYPIECTVRPYPTFEGRAELMTQRGANLCGFASDEAHEFAAAEFMKWFTDPEQNAAFAVSTGYIPVEREAFSSLPELLKYVRPEDNNLAVEKSVAAAFEAMETKEFYVKRSFENSYSANQLFGDSLSQKVNLDLEELRLRVESGEKEEAVLADFLSEENFRSWYAGLTAKMSEVLAGEEHEE